MGNFILCTILFRLALPLLILSCVVFRPSLVSGIYLLFLLISAFIPVPTPSTLKGCTGTYLKFLIAVSVIMILCQFVFQLLLLFLFPPYGTFLKSCELEEKALRHAGFVKLDALDAVSVITWVAPEVIMVLSSIILTVVCYKVGGGNTNTEEELEQGEREVGKTDEPKSKKRKFAFFVSLGRYMVLVSLCVAAVLRPSVVGGFYFLVFLCSCTWWACYKDLRRGFAILLRFCMVVVFCHISALYTYQFQWPQEFLPQNSTYARYIGLTPLLTVDCTEPRQFKFESAEWATYLNPLALLWLFYILAIESKQLLKPQSQKKQGAFSRLEGSFNGPLTRQLSQRLSDRRIKRSGTSRNRWQSATRKVRVLYDEVTNVLSESTPLIRGVSPSRRYGSNKGSVLQDSTGSVIVANDNPDDIPMQELGMGSLEDDEKPSWFENMFFIMESILQFIIRTSYIATNIIMMAWSITYHSWLTFVLLLWASVLWMVPNQRKSMLRSSPFLVIYAWFLLISAYIYSMDLTDDELPSIINKIDLSQIGFEKVTILPCKRLFAKCLYTAMFWITMRQFMKERIEARHSSALADMVAPLQITVGTATGLDETTLAHMIVERKKRVYPILTNDPTTYSPANSEKFSVKSITTGVNKDQEKGNQVMIKVGNFVKTVLTKFWIWVVAITLFAVAITGQRMTGFRILYMALFLFFIISFQFSFRVWRRMMFGFWLTVIIYSMIILVMVYTYQFNNFPEYWRDYLKVNIEQQLDIGLEKYETKQLFVRLVTPTFFVIIAVVQVHYFHKDFMELSDPKNTSLNETTKSEANSSAQGGVIVESEEGEGVDVEEEEVEDDSIKLDLTDIGNVSARQLNRKFQKFLQHVYRAVNLFLLFLEIHLPKFILFMAMLVCVQDSCAIYLIIVVLIVLGATIGKSMLSLAIYTSSLLVSILLLARMVYQIQYIEHDIWNTSCTFEKNGTDFNVTGNGAEWLGFRKIVDGRQLPLLVRWNIGFILTVTLYAIVQVRQINHRASQGRSTKRPFFMFPKIKVSNADEDLTSYIKYLFNFGFYRFGVEISLIATVALIGFRMDMYALMYSVWLCILFSMSRKTLSGVWNFYLLFIAVFIPIQYVMVIGLPPSICIDYPWDSSDILRRVQEWAYLIDPSRPLSPKKLICDFVLLLIVARQSLVFRIEKRHENSTQEYVGGSNESIIHKAEQTGFMIPVPDYITYCRTYLDIAKRIILLPGMWVTLAVVFLAGTNRVNLFSIGYLLGSFFFLWQGSDIYLKPIAKILQKWDILLAYNVFVIMMKVFLQLIGCVFIGDVQTHACWLVQILGISCVRKFKLPAAHPGIDDAAECTVPREYIGLAWDGACFMFLIIQRRIFNSYNFFHIVDESKASTILASRGAELIEELRQQRMVEQDEEEHRILEKIKAKMDRIKATQQKITGPQYQQGDNHYVDQPPLAHSSSMTSCASATSGTSQQTATPAGYHTPIDEEDEDPAPLTPVATSSLLQTNAPSPYSAIMTVSLDAYLEPQRISFSSPPNSELNPRPPSPDDSFPVFSPPPYDEAPPYAEAVSEQTTVVQRQSSIIGPPWMAGSLTTPRQSVISYCSRSPLSHHTYSIYPKSNRPLFRRKQPTSYKSAIRSGDYYMFDDIDDEELDMLEELNPKEEDDDDPLKRRDSKTRTLGELLSSTMKTDVSTVLKHKEKESIIKRRVSLPPRKRTSSICGQQSQLSVPLSAPPALRRVSLVIDKRKDKGDGPDDDEPIPGTSKDEDISDISDVPQQQSTCQRIMNYLLFLIAFINGFMLSATLHLNTYSKDYRYVIRVLTKEKKLLKENTDYNVGVRNGPSQSWEPNGTYRSLLKNSREPSFIMTPSVATYSPSDSYRLGFSGASPRRSEMLSSNSERQADLDSDESDTKALASSPLPYSTERDSHKGPIYDDEITEMSSYDQPTVLRLLLAMWYIVLSHSDMLCYFVIFLNQIKNATFMSLPLPLLVFFWGTLTVPRPSKNFWVTIIAYTQAIVLIKCMFQFEILPWNKDTYTVSPFDAPKIIGIERKKDYAVWDLFLLLVVFFHRFMLKCLGLWKTDYVPHEAPLPNGKYTLDQTGALVPVDDTHYDSSIQIIGEKGAKSSLSGSKNEDLQRLMDEDDYDSPKRIVHLSTTEVEPPELFPTSIHLTTSKYTESAKHFFQQLIDPTSRVAADVYSYMFLCDFFNFFVILIGYNSFGSQQGDEGVSSYLEDNRVPVLFLLMLILQFLLIIIDRAIFLRKNIFGKIVFQFLQIFILHLWLFVIFPATTERSVNSVIPPQMYYMVKCFYLLLSAYQIRCGYPTRILGNFLCKGYGYLNMFLYKGFMFIPFLFELRTVMDWMWTDTSMTVFDWIKMEDIFAHIFQLKCTRHIESEYPQPRGERKNPQIKYMMGGGLLAIIIAVIWFPLVFFSLGNTVGEPNPPYDVTIDLRIGPYEPIYQMSAQNNTIFSFNENDLQQFSDKYSKNRAATGFISNYIASDIAAVKLSTDSATVWSISPPDHKRMLNEVASDDPLTIRLQYIISHESNNKESPSVMREEVEITVNAKVDGKPNPVRQELLKMLQGEEDAAPVQLEYVIPKFIKVTNRGTAKAISQFMEPYPEKEASSLRNITIKLYSEPRNNSKTEPTKVWWEIKENCSDFNYVQFLMNLPYADCNYFILYTFNDKIFPATLNIITGGGIIGLYTTLVFVASRILRQFFSEICFKIMFDDMPCVDRVLQLCLDIYLVREAGEYALEEDLFAKLVFLYRSPETLIKWTRPKEELGEDEDPEGDDQNQ